MNNIFITGGLGQDGKILTKILLKKNFRVLIFGRKKNNIKNKKIKYFNNNLLNLKKLEKIFLINKPDVIVHLAANNPAYNEEGYKKFYKNNINASKNIFKSSFKYNPKVKLLFANSSQIFKKNSGTVNEYSKQEINSYYTRFRIEFDKFMLSKKVNYTNIIIFNHDSKYKKKKFLLPRLMKSIKYKNVNLLKKILSENIFGDFSHAEDICNGIYKIINSNKRIKKVILSSNKCTSVNNLIKFIIKKNKVKINLDFNVNKKRSKCLKGNNDYAKKIINWRPKKNIFIAANEIFNNL